MDDPCLDHTADLGDEVYDALQAAWEDSDVVDVEVEIDGETYRLAKD